MQLLSDVRELSRIGYGFMASKTLFAALDLEVFTHLAQGPLSLTDLRRLTGATHNGLQTLLRACVSLGLLGVDGERYFNGPAAATFLAKGSPHYYGDYFRYQIDKQVYPTMMDLEKALHGLPTEPFYERVASAEQAARFSHAQHVGSLGPAHLLARRIDGSAWKQLLDVAGGTGAFSITFCQRNPGLRATIIDFPNVVAVTGDYARRAQLADRIGVLAGEAISTAWPAGQDAVLMSYLLSAISADSFPALFEKAHGALQPGGTVIVHDFMLDDSRHGPTNAALWFVMNSISGPQHVSFAPADLAKLLEQAGFERLEAFELLPGITRVVTARKPT